MTDASDDLPEIEQFPALMIHWHGPAGEDHAMQFLLHMTGQLGDAQ